MIIPNVPFTNLRVILYGPIGFNIGKNVFIGMKCYLDDAAIKNTIIEDNVTISYGCHFACHGKSRGSYLYLNKKRGLSWCALYILPGKEGIIIGADSFVNKSIENNCIVVGVPIMVLLHKNKEGII